MAKKGFGFAKTVGTKKTIDKFVKGKTYKSKLFSALKVK